MKSHPGLLLGLATLAFAATAFAQNSPPTPARPSAKSERELRMEAKLEALAAPPAPAAAAMNDDDSAPVVTDSAAWRMEQAQKLLRAGMRLKEKGETALAADAAAKALTLLDGAAEMIDGAKHPALAAQRNELVGLIHERITGNTAQARVSYEAAKQSSPGSAKLAESRLKRLDRAEGRPEKPAVGDNTKGGNTDKPKG